MNTKLILPNKKHFKMSSVIVFSFFFFLFLVIESCTKCQSREELLASAKPSNIPVSDKNDFAFYHINKMTFLLNDTSVLVFNLTSKNFQYNPYIGSFEGSCQTFDKKDEENSFVYSSSSQMLPNITTWQKTFVNQTNFDINFSGYIPNFNANSSVVYRGIGTQGGLQFILSNFLKLDSIKTSFDSIYYNVYLFRSPNDTIYYSPTKGIVKMIFYNNNKFELIKA
ncbi:MAG: hypothetical protein WCO28_13405, partial [Bacteroidota bacterium]